MAIRRKQLGMSSGHKIDLSTRLYWPDGSRNIQGEKDRLKEKEKNANL